MIRTMRAVVLRDHGGPEVLTLEEVPDPLIGPEEVLVDVRATALNRADLLQRMGLYPGPAWETVEIPGLELAGVVAAIGPRVTMWQPGDAVMGIVSGGAYAERVAVHERQLMAVPTAVPLADAAAIPEVFLTAWDALVVQGGLTSGRWALVHAGSVGGRHRGDPDRQGDRGPHRGDDVDGQGGRLPRARCRCRHRLHDRRTSSRRSGPSPAGRGRT